MKTAKLLLAVAIAVDATAAFAAPRKRDTPIGADNAAIGNGTTQVVPSGPARIAAGALASDARPPGFPAVRQLSTTRRRSSGAHRRGAPNGALAAAVAADRRDTPTRGMRSGCRRDSP